MVTYIKSAKDPREYPAAKFLEIVFVGRSNVGKSSLINALFKTKVAKTSSTPGKTHLLNFFSWSDVDAYLVDVPGYGFARRPKTEREGWREMMEVFLQAQNRGQRLALLLIDVIREWQAEEEMLVDYLSWVHIPYVLVVTKIDRCRKDTLRKRMHFWQNCSFSSHPPLDLFFVSARTLEGCSTVYKYLITYARKIKYVQET
ncbi:MAG: ribosome biogenesis GTP-binding protein YihA/YsxC [Bdellovibrionaceae bacterium]|nr:ribosome biogenesis GTP-binding protein YihA/YsxC [Pseudobdellovibrionaceae bacterium]MDW8189832.1 ribosome biogenesis GTP-binding protein YihA/YsxC [Pseudobdellovibrionaceae bacterium]